MGMVARAGQMAQHVGQTAQKVAAKDGCRWASRGWVPRPPMARGRPAARSASCRQVCVYERGHRQDRLEPLAPCGPPRTDCNPLLKGTHTSHGPMASLL